ncbi:CYTH domain-containing protein [Planococcus sp. FY231025]|uniref:CYTH domain-containing protein n=1 Tax=Planococcus sp. FY231025 TaxID=3455699 RepID=UPI003F8E6720
MTKELEIEFKNMLTQTEYEGLLTHFKRTAEEAETQENYYFDTQDFQLKRKKCALRIRRKGESFECTLKTPAPEGNYEITDRLPSGQAMEMIEGRSFHSPEVQAALEELQVNSAKLHMIGKLTTHRTELEIDGGLLVLDHSEYGGKEDFEVEFEVAEAAAGKTRFLGLLQSHTIPERPADKKIARFMAAAKEQAARKTEAD